ncbi:MAG: sodium:calcium antiporter [Candidatus Woesearchaeota archaeon]
MIDNIINIMNSYPVISNIIIVGLSFLILIKASDLIIFGISNYARKFGISDYLIGFLVVAIGMSLPEFSAAINGAIVNDSGVVLGTIFGSNIITLTLVLGVLAIAGHKINLESRLLRETGKYLLPLSVLPFFVFLNKEASRIDGLILILVFLVYIIMLWKKEGTFGKLRSVKIKFIWKDAFVFVGALVALLLSARWLVFSSINLSYIFGVSSYLVALIIIGFGSSLPDLTVQIKAVRSGHHNIGFGNVLGSTITKMLLLLGIVIMINPIKIDFSLIIVSIIFYVVSMLFVIFLIKNKEMDYKHGILLIAVYLIFIFIEILKEFNII